MRGLLLAVCLLAVGCRCTEHSQTATPGCDMQGRMPEPPQGGDQARMGPYQQPGPYPQYQQGMPQGMPPQGMPPQGMPPQGMPQGMHRMHPGMGGMPPPGMFMPPQFRGRGMPPMHMDPGPIMAIKRLQEELVAKDHEIAELKSILGHQKIHPEQDYHAQGITPQGLPPQGMGPQGMPPQGIPPQGMAPQGMAPQGMPPQGMAPQHRQPEH